MYLFASDSFRPTTVEDIGCNYCRCSFDHKSTICSSEILKITNMPHTPRILCWNIQKQKKLIPAASRCFSLRRRHSMAVADLSTTIHGFHFTIRFDKNVPSLGATFHSSQSKGDTSKFTANRIPSKTNATQPTRHYVRTQNCGTLPFVIKT